MFGDLVTAAIGAFKAFEIGMKKLDEYLAWQKELHIQKIAQDLHDVRTALSQPTTGEEKDALAKKLSEITSRL